MERVREDVRVLEGRRAAVLTAPELAIVVVLVGLLAFFVAFAPAS